jgi:hypothetical protein
MAGEGEGFSCQSLDAEMDLGAPFLADCLTYKNILWISTTVGLYICYRIRNPPHCSVSADRLLHGQERSFLAANTRV